MKELKGLIKKNWILLVISIGVILVVVIVLLTVFRVDTKREFKEGEYFLYLMEGSNSLVELEFYESHYECRLDDDVSICSNIETNVDGYQILDISLNETFTDEDMLNQNLVSVLTKVVDTYVNLNPEVNEFIIASNLHMPESIVQELQEATSHDIIFYIDYQSNLDEVRDSHNYYTVTFDTAGGSSIDSVVVKDGDAIEKPSDPNRDGYNFVGWYLGDIEYDFASLVTEDLTLIAKWEEVSEEVSNSTTPSKSNEINLNDNLKATLYHKDTGDTTCFFYMFVSNLTNVYPNLGLSDYSNSIKRAHYWPGDAADKADSEVSNDDLNNSSLSFDASKESSLESIFAKYENASGINIERFNNDNHRISFTYHYITFNGLDVADGTKANAEIQKALDGSTLFQGPCGGYDYYENITLTEELCDEFNLTCGRW